MVAETRAKWIDVSAKSQFTEPPPESREMVDEMLGRTGEREVIAESEMVVGDLMMQGLMEVEEG